MAALLCALSFLAAHLVTVALFLWRRFVPAPPQEHGIGLPRLTLLRPVCGVDRYDEETLRSSFTQDYPDYEIIFCAPSEDDPAVALVRRLMADYPARPARLLIGEDRISANPKLNNVWKGWHAARTDWICMTDSNLMLTPDYLRAVVAAWGPGVGLVSGPPVGSRPDGWGGHLECAFLNANQARLQFAADSFGSGFAQGKTLFFNRPLVECAGGLRMLAARMAEDVSATLMTLGLGRQVRLTRLPFAQPIGARSLRQVWDRQLRWSRVRRDGFPWLFALEPLNGVLVALIACLIGLAGLGLSPAWALVFLGLWYGAEIALMRLAGWPSGWRDIAALVLRDLMLPAIWLATFRARSFEWRGNAVGSSPAAR